MRTMKMTTLDSYIDLCQKKTNEIFDFYLKKTHGIAPILQEAMSYAVFNGGKRLRPLFVFITGSIFEAPMENLAVAASAVELIHTYSLIHDDLPAMDNSDLRRGKPSCHKAFTEGIAILAGDTLQTLAFEIITNHSAQLNATQRLQMIQALTHASGLNGMATGQALDITMNKNISLEKLIILYQLKTGALLNASTQLGLIAANINDPKIKNSLEKFTQAIGLAFQIQDDILDIECSTDQLGKPQGLDQQNNKMTYPMHIGLEQAKQKVKDLFETAINEITLLGEKSGLLCDLANYLLYRNK